MYEGSHPHIYWIDLKNDGVFVQCAVMKIDELGNVYYIALNTLDEIDTARITKIVNNRNAAHFEMWDLMSNITLSNGINALEYFHQMVNTVTANGKLIKASAGAIGAASAGVISMKNNKKKIVKPKIPTPVDNHDDVEFVEDDGSDMDHRIKPTKGRRPKV